MSLSEHVVHDYMSPGWTPARSSASAPRRSRSRWNRSADSSTSKSVWAATRSMRRPRTRTRRPPRGSTVNASRRGARSGGRRRRPAPAARRARRRPAAAGDAARKLVETLARRRGDRDGLEVVSLRGPARNAGQASAAAGRSSLLNATRIGFSSSAGSWARSSSRITLVSPSSGSRARAIDDVDQHPRPLDVAQEGVAETGARARALDEPGHVGDRRPAPSSSSPPPGRCTPRFGSSVVNG